MYPISSVAKAMYDKNYRQVILIRMDTEDTTYTLTENDIIAGSFSIDRYSITGSRIEIGTACAGECKFRIKNYDKRWDAVRFEGAQLFIRIGIADWSVPGAESNVIWMPCGYFTVDKPVRNASILSIEALDRMAKLDKPVDWSMFTGSFNPRTIIARICELCNVMLYNGASLANLPNASYVVNVPTDMDMTYRNLLQAACMLLGACAFFNENGLLVIKWYTTTTVTIDESKRYSHTIQENNIKISGVVYTDTSGDEDVEYIYGTKDYAIDISDNPLVGSKIQTCVNALGKVLKGFTYRPYSASIKPSPYLYPTDMITFKKNGVSYKGIVSNITYGINSNTSIEGKGETEEDSGYATYGNLTHVQSKILEYSKKKIDRELDEVSQQIDDRAMLLMNLNEMVMNSLGLYETSVEQPTGGYQYYFHDQPTPADSSIIYTFTANGFAWTDDWNDGNPVWNYGITRDGNAIINMLSAYKISADIITAGTMRAVNLIFGKDPNTTELRTNDAETGALFDGTGVMQFHTKGEFRATNVDSNDKNANLLLLSNTSTSSTAYLYNRLDDTLSNYLYFNNNGTRNYSTFGNNLNGSTAGANYLSFESNATDRHIYLRNANASGTMMNTYWAQNDADQSILQFDNSDYTTTGTKKRANAIEILSDKTNNRAVINNYKPQTDFYFANSLTLKYVKDGAGTECLLSNYRYGATTTQYANRLTLEGKSSGNDTKLNNYYHDVVSSENKGLIANNVVLHEDANENYTSIINNYLANGDGTDSTGLMANMISLGAVRSTSANTITIENMLIRSTRDAFTGNKITMVAQPSSTKQILVENNNANNTSSNVLLLEGTNYPYIRLVNYQKDNTYSGSKYIASSIYLKQTSNVNSFDFYNNRKSATTNLEEASGNHLAMYTQESTYSTAFRVNNYHWNGNDANLFMQGSQDNESYCYIRNYDSSGKTRTALNMNKDGTFKLYGVTGGTNSIEALSNGNLDVVGNNAVVLRTTNTKGIVSIKTDGVQKDCQWVNVNGRYFLAEYIAQ